MKLIVCLDDRKGMLFGGKRQSRDRVVCEKIIMLTKGCKLWMNGYSAKLFAGIGNVTVDESFLEHAQPGDCCFVENGDFDTYADQIDQVIVFKWNRHYPADRRFPWDLSTWKLVKTEDFPGSSHDRITMEVYLR